MLDEEVKIRPARQRDAAALVPMITALAVHHGDVAACSVEQLHGDLFGRRRWARAIVATVERRLVGYAILMPLFRAHFGQRGLEIHHLFVEEAFRARGVGQALIAFCIDYARANGCAYVAVGTAAENHRAQGYYQRLGFVPRTKIGPNFTMAL